LWPGGKTWQLLARQQRGCVEAVGGVFFAMSIHSVLITPAVALIAGILILLIPRLLNLIVALYLILIGLLGIAPHLMR